MCTRTGTSKPPQRSTYLVPAIMAMLTRTQIEIMSMFY